MLIPANAQELTTTWLTDALKSSDTIRNSRVASFEISDVGDGQGITAEMRRIHLQYDIDEMGAPESLIAKFPSPGKKERDTYFNFTYHYPKEMLFYQRIAPKVPITVPRCYYGDMNIDKESFALLIEDLAPARSCDTAAGCNLHTARLAMHEIARLHAQWWNSPELKEMTWLPQWGDNQFNTIGESVEVGWEPFVEKMKGTVPDGILALRAKLARQTSDLMRENARPPCTLTHFDYMPDNLFIGSAGELIVIDWQLTTIGKGAFDIACLLGGGVDAALRTDQGGSLLDDYYRSLLDGGVNGYSRTQCDDDYRLSLLHLFTRFVVVVGAFGVSAEQEKRFCQAIAPRIISALLDSNADELL